MKCYVDLPRLFRHHLPAHRGPVHHTAPVRIEVACVRKSPWKLLAATALAVPLAATAGAVGASHYWPAYELAESAPGDLAGFPGGFGGGGFGFGGGGGGGSGSGQVEGIGEGAFVNRVAATVTVPAPGGLPYPAVYMPGTVSVTPVVTPVVTPAPLNVPEPRSIAVLIVACGATLIARMVRGL